MQTELLQAINAILKRFPDYWEEEKLLRYKVIDDIQSKKPELIKAFIQDKKVAANYSTDIEGVMLFDFEGLASMLKYKEYWANSYTKYRNSIGLSSEGKYLKYDSDVVLDFPFKDCVLEGGMSTEETGKDEVFYNEIIARDEIDRLFSPKVFSNAKRFSKDGIEENITCFSDKDNLIIKGNNLIALHSLKERFAGKIKLIYIDPPYNTDEDSFRYNDRFNRSSWLAFMKNRLEAAVGFLSEDGSIFVQCDDNQQAYLKVLMDEIFAEKNFNNVICIKMSHLSGPKMAQRNKKIPKIKEYILIYSKNKDNFSLNEVIQKSTWEEKLSRYDNFLIRNDSNPYNWKVKNLNSVIKDRKIPDEEIENFKILNAKNIFRTARNNSEQFKEIKKEKSFSKLKTANGLEKYCYNGEEVIFASKFVINNEVISPIGDIWLDIGINNLHNEGGVSLKNGKKPEKLLERIIELVTTKNDLVLDFFVGSGTTAAVSHKMGRRYIGIEQMDYINEITVPRLQKVIEGEQGGISKAVEWHGGGSFVYAELKQLNYDYMTKITAAKSYADLLPIFADMREHAHLNYLVELDKVLNSSREIEGEIEKVEFKDLPLDKQKETLISLLDANQLYVNASEMDDERMHVSESEKTFTKSFYSRGE